ncbi:hypothetical protein UY3_05124 [Chelonia mydas]|uniref:Uncharacterized protein n=1 Tax=Chelonia mydas TaxID=8469 RepID=M7BKD1_CHEMY|nr:hypothetical protein UY3_05124 [Chelonia mydas]
MQTACLSPAALLAGSHLWYVHTTRQIVRQRSIQQESIYCIYSRRNKLTPENSPVNSCTPPPQEAQAELTGERQQSTHHGEDTTVSRSKYVDFSYVIHVADVA